MSTDNVSNKTTPDEAEISSNVNNNDVSTMNKKKATAESKTAKMKENQSDHLRRGKLFTLDDIVLSEDRNSIVRLEMLMI